MQIDKTKPVLVTGGNGYIASWIVKYLLADGHDVHATVRDPAKVSELRSRLMQAGLPPRTLLTAMGPGFTASCVSLQAAA